MTTPDQSVQVLRGTLHRIFQHKEVDGWMTGTVKYQESGEFPFPKEIKVVGKIPDPVVDSEYEFYGRETEHAKFGKQFQFHSYQLQLPITREGIFIYLWKTTRHLGMSRARAVVEAYGTKTLVVLKDEPQRVANDISGISFEKAREISIVLIADEETQQARIWLEQEIGGDKGVSSYVIGLLLQQFGIKAPDAVKSNPYRLTHIANIAWSTVDKIGRRLGYDEEGYDRRLAACLQALKDASSEGHSFIGRHDIKKRVKKMLAGVEAGNAIEDEHAYGRDSGWIQLPKLADAEKRLVDRIKLLVGPLKGVEFPPPPGHFEEDQVEAWGVLTTQRLVLLIGGPGTGKTTVSAELVKAEISMGREVLMVAPTGKAAKRMQEAMGGDFAAFTIHSALGGRIGPGGKWWWGYHRDNPHPAKTIICDETSMLDILTSADLAEAIHPEARFILVGDENQLPSIGPGSVLRDLIIFGVPTARLRTIKRFAGDLVRVVHMIAEAKPSWLMPFSEKLDLDNGHNVRWLDAPSDEAGMKQIQHYVPQILTRMRDDYGFDPRWDCQIITPLNKKTDLSVQAFNKQLREFFLPDAVEFAGQSIVCGEKVIQTRNKPMPLADDPATVVMCVNGDLGEVISIDPEENQIVVQHWSPDRKVVYPWQDHRLKPAWALTIHKCQGSGFPVVILPMHTDLIVRNMWSRNLLYTALSRTEKVCLLVGDREAFDKAIPIDVTDQRKTLLVERLEKAFGRERLVKPKGKWDR